MTEAEQTGTPYAHVELEAERVLRAAEERRVNVRLMGGLAIYFRSESARISPLSRSYGDIDVVGYASQSSAITQLFTDLGYKADRRFNTLHGHKRLLFWDDVNARQLDVFLDNLQMCHAIPLKGRLETERHTMPLAELLLSKLQIVEINVKDIRDIIGLLIDFPIGEGDGDQINAGYIARLAAREWGLYRTMQLSVARVLRHAADLDLRGRYQVADQMELLMQRVEQEPKPVAWRVRAAIGDRVRWYEVADEVRE